MEKIYIYIYKLKRKYYYVYKLNFHRRLFHIFHVIRETTLRRNIINIEDTFVFDHLIALDSIFK